ncbi:hypothetical protein E4U42_002130 [Claviceps africana]|uniref:Uncharacterized protein n=1 Tax=Claviceps africana TaxID=83212 RepID=A0A8K0NMH7_9HYPO|nr:hypothetical protein E4U42_002130 [Claviceps africana]
MSQQQAFASVTVTDIHAKVLPALTYAATFPSPAALDFRLRVLPYHGLSSSLMSRNMIAS